MIDEAEVENRQLTPELGKEDDVNVGASPKIIERKTEEHLKDPKFEMSNIFMSEEDGIGRNINELNGDLKDEATQRENYNYQSFVDTNFIN